MNNMATIDPRDHPPDDFLEFARATATPDPTSRRLLSTLIGRGIHDPAIWGQRFQIPNRLRDRIAPLPRLTLDRSITSPIDGFQKLAFRTLDNLII